MALYVGETITVQCSATDATNHEVIVDAKGLAEFYAPGKHPARVPADREPDREVELFFDAASESYLAYVETRGWLPGKWTYRVALLHEYASWEYGSFTLRV